MAMTLKWRSCSVHPVTSALESEGLAIFEVTRKLLGEYKPWLMVWHGLEDVLFSHILGMSYSQLTNSMIFQRGRAQPPTRYTIYISKEKRCN